LDILNTLDRSELSSGKCLDSVLSSLKEVCALEDVWDKKHVEV